MNPSDGVVIFFGAILFFAVGGVFFIAYHRDVKMEQSQSQSQGPKPPKGVTEITDKNAVQQAQALAMAMMAMRQVAADFASMAGKNMVAVDIAFNKKMREMGKQTGVKVRLES